MKMILSHGSVEDCVVIVAIGAVSEEVLTGLGDCVTVELQVGVDSHITL